MSIFHTITAPREIAGQTAMHTHQFTPTFDCQAKRGGRATAVTSRFASRQPVTHFHVAVTKQLCPLMSGPAGS
jgi:hypothetical protein